MYGTKTALALLPKNASCHDPGCWARTQGKYAVSSEIQLQIPHGDTERGKKITLSFISLEVKQDFQEEECRNAILTLMCFSRNRLEAIPRKPPKAHRPWDPNQAISSPVQPVVNSPYYFFHTKKTVAR